jgi:fucose 4-O-acetylase-like acetyltransferase
MHKTIEKTTVIARDSHQDLIKGIGIILVVVGHALRGGLSGAYGKVDQILFFFDFLIYGVHMPLFFFFCRTKFLQNNEQREWVFKI